MKHQTYKDIKWIEKLGNRGKYLQLILGKTLETGGCKLHDCNLVEGKDLYVEYEDKKYGLEVKTCDSNKVKIGEKDLKDIRETGRDVNPGFAVLRIHSNADWRITDPRVFEVVSQYRLPVSAMRANPIEKLQKLVDKEHDKRLHEIVREMKKKGYGKDNELGIQTLKGDLFSNNFSG